MKIKNSKTGEVIDLSEPASSAPAKKDFKSLSAETDTRIKERGTIQDSAKKIITDKGAVKKTIAGAEVISAPLNSIESGISNPALQIQKGNANPMDLVKEAILGFSLQKQGQYGDIMKNAGYNPVLADSAGLVLNLSPIKVFNAAAKTFGSISKMSDKALEKTGRNLLYAIDDAKKAVGTKVTQEYAKKADAIPVDGLQFINDVADLPKPIMKKLELAFGKMEDFAQGMNVGKVREFKRYLGKLKPNAYGNDAKGLKDTLDVKDINKVYGRVQDTMKKVMSDKTSGLDKSEVTHLLDLDDSYHDVINAGRYIKKTINDSVLGKPTKVGELAQQVTSATDSTSRVALSTIKKASRTAQRNVNTAMRRIENFNRWQNDKQVMSRAFGALAFGGFAGAVGGGILRKAQDSSKD